MPSGGKREGAGRPATGRIKAVTVKLSEEACKVLENQQNKSKYLDELIKASAK